MDPVSDVIGDFPSPCGVFTLTFHDDGKVAYAYLKRGIAILGDVWIYNRRRAPDQSEWKDRKNLPFANCKGYIKGEGFVEKPITLDDIGVEWAYTDGQPKAYVWLFGDRVALVSVGSKPGYSRFASRDGPLAKRMIADDSFD